MSIYYQESLTFNSFPITFVWIQAFIFVIIRFVISAKYFKLFGGVHIKHIKVILFTTFILAITISWRACQIFLKSLSLKLLIIAIGNFFGFFLLKCCFQHRINKMMVVTYTSFKWTYIFKTILSCFHIKKSCFDCWNPALKIMQNIS